MQQSSPLIPPKVTRRTLVASGSAAADAARPATRTCSLLELHPRGSKLDADPPHTGVKIPRLITPFLEGRKLAWLTGPNGLRVFVGRTRGEVLRMIGKFDQAWLDRELAKGMRFKLIVMPQAECRLADWDGVFEMVEARYPKVAPKLHRWREGLRDPSLAGEIGAELVSDVVKSNLHHPDHMSAQRYLVCDDTARNARLFLWHSLGMNDQFVGDGYTAVSSNGLRLDEYLTTNVPLQMIPGVVMIDLPVEPGRSES